MDGLRDESYYTRRSSLPPVPEDENEENETTVFPLPFFVVPNISEWMNWMQTCFAQSGQNRSRSIFGDKFGENEVSTLGSNDFWHEQSTGSWQGGYASYSGSSLDFGDSFTQEERAEFAGVNSNRHIINAADRHRGKRIGILLLVTTFIVLVTVAAVLWWYSYLQEDDNDDTRVGLYCSCKCEDLKAIEECRAYFQSFGKFVQYMNSTRN